MAHADYHCCAICDSKLAYSSEPETKETICSCCVAEMAKQGIIIPDVNALKQWIKDNPKKEVARILKSVGYHQCYYGNEVDDLILEKGIKIVGRNIA